MSVWHWRKRWGSAKSLGFILSGPWVQNVMPVHSTVFKLVIRCTLAHTTSQVSYHISVFITAILKCWFYTIIAAVASTEAGSNTFLTYHVALFWQFTFRGQGSQANQVRQENFLLLSPSLSSLSFVSNFSLSTTISVLASGGCVWLMASGVQGSTHERGPVTHLRRPYVCLHELCASGGLPLPEDIREAAGCH